MKTLFVMLFLMLLMLSTMSASAQQQLVLCRTMDGTELVYEEECPPGMYFVRYIF